MTETKKSEEQELPVVRELVVSSQTSEVDIALLEDGVLAELHKEKPNNQFAVGDVYLGRIKKILPGLNAAFVDMGSGKEGFLHYLDLGTQINSLIKFKKMVEKDHGATMEKFQCEPDVEKKGSISDIISVNELLPVQVAKEPISTKGPRVSAEISFAGRYIVLVPFSNHVSVSQKIRGNEERSRLRRLIQSIRPKNYGIIVRTMAEGKKVAELDADLKSLVDKWERCIEVMRQPQTAGKMVSEMDRTSVILRDLLNESFNSVYVDNKDLYDEIRDYTNTISPQKKDIVKLYQDEQPIFEKFNVARQIRGLFGKVVTIKNGIYLIIEHTEAMHVIDVNSGHRVSKDNSQEENALLVNLASAKEIARQLRLRDMGGIIIVDFIDMHEAKHRKELFDCLVSEMARDRAKHTILPATKFGLIQITRQRVRPATEVQVQEKCPVCNGEGKIRPSMLYVDDIESNLRYLLIDQNEKNLTLQVHPFIYSYLTKGPISIRMRWMWKYKRYFKVRPVSSFHMLQSNFLNSSGDDIQL